MNILDIIVAVVGSTALSTILNFVFRMIEKKQDKETANKRAMRLTLLYILKESGKQYCDDGVVSESDYNAFSDTYSTYKALGGDGYADRICELVKKLPIKWGA